MHMEQLTVGAGCILPLPSQRRTGRWFVLSQAKSLCGLGMKLVCVKTTQRETTAMARPVRIMEPTRCSWNLAVVVQVAMSVLLKQTQGVTTIASQPGDMLHLVTGRGKCVGLRNANITQVGTRKGQC